MAFRSNDRSKGAIDDSPLDINFAKVADWLIERKKLPQKWPERIHDIRAQLSLGLKTMPDIPEISELLQGSFIDYYRAKIIFEALGQTETGKATNFLGQYSSPVMKTWYSVIKAYEKDNVYLGEVSKLLVQNGVYEIPALKKTLQQNEKQIADINRKIQDYGRTINDNERKHQQACKELNIEGKAYRPELLKSVKDLPGLMRAIVLATKKEGMKNAIKYHEEFTTYLHSIQAPETGGKAGKKSGNKGKSKPNKIEIDVSAETAQNRLQQKRMEYLQQIIHSPMGTDEDCGLPQQEDDGADTGANDGMAIDWDAAAQDSGEADIDWDFGGPDTGAEQAISWDEPQPEEDASANATGIEWDFTSTDEVTGDAGEAVSGDDSLKENYDTVNVDGQEEDRGESTALKLLNDHEFRTNFSNNLLELQSFLAHRLEELRTEHGVSAFGVGSSAPASLQQQPLDVIQEYKRAVDSVLTEMNSSKLIHLLMIQQSGKYLDRTVNGLQQRIDHISKLKSMISKLEEKRDELSKEMSLAFPKIARLREETLILKKQAEKSISAMFNNRKVHIIGEINNL